MSRPRKTARACLVAGLLIVLVAACSPKGANDPGETPAPVALIGWDGAAWEVIAPLLPPGRPPNLPRPLDDGTRGYQIFANHEEDVLKVVLECS